MLKDKALLILFLSSVTTIVFNPNTLLCAQTVPATRIHHGAKEREALRLLSQARTNALTIKNLFQHDLLLDEIGAAQAKAGDLDAAMETANASDFPPDRTLDEIGKLLAKTNDLAMAQALGGKLKRGGLPSLLANLVDAQAKNGDTARAFQTAGLISIPEIRSYALERIALQQAVAGDDAGSRKTFSLAREAYPSGSLDPNELETIFLLRDFSKEKTSEARARIEALKSADEKFSTMLALAEVLSKKGDHAEANLWLGDALKVLPTGSESDFWRYLAIPVQVRLGQKEAALMAAGALTPELRVKGYLAVAVTCAETKDVVGVGIALDKMNSVPLVEPYGGVSRFGLALMTLNITSALIDNGQFREAARLLDTLKERGDETSYKMGIEPRLQLQRVLILAQESQFEVARSLALKMRLNSITELERGRALRIIALLQTRERGTSHSLPWSRALLNMEDQAYALLGVAQALLEIDEVKLGYSAIQVH